MRGLGALVGVFTLLVLSAAAQAQVTLYGSPGPEQEQLQRWIDTSRAPTPNVRVRLYEGNCRGTPPESEEVEGQPASPIQTCASFVKEGPPQSSPTNQAIYIPHMTWHPQLEDWWWHLNLLNELGHIYDVVVGEHDHHRQKFARIFGFDPSWWWPVNGWAAINAGWEKWSMAFAFCGYGMRFPEAHRLIANGEYTGFGFDPSASEYAAACRLDRGLHGRGALRTKGAGHWLS